MDLPEPALEKAVYAPSLEEERSYSREDGTLVINILVDPPCGESSASEIVVCAPDQSANRLERTEAPAEPDNKVEVSLGKNAKANLRAESDPSNGGDSVIVGVTIKF
ncbi:hypothetical protein [Altererythrobacter sp. Root672]|uniref:hypothetical protein n=1 Tax=Altererythrobacter sp. Root672 TaxID=1736584 RepID=UPI0007022BB4|nr:hypothetical protein [Altererythrobacter sp. Root672]KRA82718.1 hypothetical protein ASD76_01080 [Altererythrobacter sp. Root672]